MRENQAITGYWYTTAPIHSGFFVGGSGIFQIYDSKPEGFWRVPVFREAVMKWRIDSIRSGGATYPCPCDKPF